ncbi:dynein heavy chain family protein (macronuclear) [Tetrahymena thermophila SB210]|uniref:Dynein heavy chain family protein n=1 Tax=Tetrahymena thermophila (strain SB210) TaxID=312017 RepID=Q22M08_TETTS|nr:dynein heavy chain family protein [Tetrahymena thermophila SB210]EAR86276.2 dynein heavy chain family protein [Tetrahymena thermophila SB210]|eukprot:XP_977212.2 dynein heavy chain family protein [Tetrahymena thermophila SB210]
MSSSSQRPSNLISQQSQQQLNEQSKTKTTFRSTKKDEARLLPHEVFDSMEELQNLKTKYPSLRQTYRVVKPSTTMNRSISSNFFPSSKQNPNQPRSKYDLNAYFKVNTDRWYSGLDEAKPLNKHNDSLQEINHKTSRTYIFRQQDDQKFFRQESGPVGHQYQQSMPPQTLNNVQSSDDLFRQLPRNLQSAINLPNLYSQVEENERMINPLRSDHNLLNPYTSNNPHNKSRQSSLTNLNFKIKKLHNTYYNSSQRSLIESNPDTKETPFTYIDFFQQGDMIHIKVSNLNNFKVEPLEKFDEGRLYDEDPRVYLNSGVFRGYSKWQEPDGSFIWKDCLVKDYNPETAKFTIQWVANKKIKEVSRLNLMYDHENQEIADTRYRLAKEKREQMLYFISLKQKIGETSSESKEILFRKKNLIRILDLIFNTEFLKENEEQWKRQVINDILQAYKFDVIKFVYQANTVQSLYELFKTYYPDELVRRKLKIYNLQLNLNEIEEFTNEVTVNEQKQQEPQNAKKKYQNSFFIPDRVKEEEPEQNIFEYNYNVKNWVYETEFAQQNEIEPEKAQPTFTTAVEGQMPSKLRNQFRKITLSTLTIAKNLFIEYTTNNLSKSLRFNYDPKFLQLHTTLPQFMKAISSLEETTLFQYFASSGQNYQSDVFPEFDRMNIEFNKQKFKIEKIFDKIELSINEIIFDVTRNMGFESKEIKKLNLHHKLKECMQKITNYLVQSYMSKTIQNSIYQLCESFQKYYAILPYEDLNSEDLVLIDPQIKIIRLLKRLTYCYDNPSIQINKRGSFVTQTQFLLSFQEFESDQQQSQQEIIQEQQNKIPSNLCLPQIYENNQVLSSKEVFKRFGNKFQNTFETQEKKRFSANKIIYEMPEDPMTPQNVLKKQKNTENINRESAGSIKNLEVLNEESEEQQDDFSEWRWIKDSKIIFMIYTKMCEKYLSDQFLNNRYKQIEKTPIQPLFNLRVVINDDKNLSKKIKSIYKTFKFNKMDQQKMSDILFRSREQLYSYSDLTFEDMFYEIASRNDLEYSIENIEKEIGQATITKGRLGWFNYSSFLVTFEPPLETFEEKFKDQFSNALINIKNLNKIFGEFASDKVFRNDDVFQNQVKLINENIDSFLLNGLYGAYSLLHLLNRFEFYYLHSENYEKFIKGMYDDDQLTEVFREQEKMKKDINFFQQRLPDEINLGFLVVYLKEFKNSTLIEINKKLDLIKVLSKEKFKNLLDKNIQSHEEILKNMEKEPTTIQEYIEILLYVQGTELQNHINTMDIYQEMATYLYDKFYDQLIIIDSDMLILYFNAKSMLQDVKNNREAKLFSLQKIKQKFEEMHHTDKTTVKDNIESLMKKIEQLKQETSFDRAFEVAGLSQEILTELNYVEYKVKVLQYEEIHLSVNPDQYLNIQEDAFNFRTYDQLWKYTSEWKMKKEEWLKKPLLSHNVGGFTNADIKEISSTLDQGIKTLKEVEPYFKQYNQKLMPLIETLTSDIGQFERVYELLVQVKHESFKSEHWAQIFEVMYQDNQKKVDEMLACLKTPQFNLSFLIANNALEHLGFVSNIAGEAQEEFKSQETIDNLKNEFQNINFDAIDFHNIPLIVGLKDRVSDLRHQYFTVGEMLRNKIYQRNDFTEKLSQLEYVVKNTMKVLKRIAKIQDRLVAYAPLYRFKKNEPYLKQSTIIYNQVVEDFKKTVKDIEKKGMKYFTALFVKEEEDSKTQQEIHEKFSSIYTRSNYVRQLVQIMARQIRFENPRMAFFSDEKIIQLCSCQFYPKEFFQYISVVYPGIKEFVITKTENESRPGQNDLSVKQVINEYGEKLDLLYTVTYQLGRNDEPPVFTFMNEIEMQLKEFFKNSLQKNIKGISNCYYNYQQIWTSYITSGAVPFQILYLINDICFYHDVTALLSINDGLEDLNEYSSPQEVKARTKDSGINKLRNILQSQLSNFQVYFQSVIKHNNNPKFVFPFTQFILQIQNHINILGYLLNNLAFRLDSFEYLSLPKFSLEFNRKELDKQLFNKVQIQNLNALAQASLAAQQKKEQQQQGELIPEGEQTKKATEGDDGTTKNQPKQPQVVLPKNCAEIIQMTYTATKQASAMSYGQNDLPNINAKSLFMNLVQEYPFDVVLLSMNYKRLYGYEVNPIFQNYVFTESSNRIFAKILGAFSASLGACLRSPPQSGKRENAKALSFMLAKPFFEWNFDEKMDSFTVQNILTGFASGSYWLYVTNLEKCNMSVISTMAQVMFAVKKALVQGYTQFPFGDLTLPCNNQFGLMCSYQITQDGNKNSFEILPKSLLENFRIINFIQPDIEPIFRQYFLMLGVKDYQVEEKLKQFLLFFSFLSSSFDKQYFLQKNMLTEQDLGDIKYSKFEGMHNVFSMKSLIKFMHISLMAQINSKYESDPIEILKNQLDLQLQATLSQSAYQFIKITFSRFFTENTHKKKFIKKAPVVTRSSDPNIQLIEEPSIHVKMPDFELINPLSYSTIEKYLPHIHSFLETNFIQPTENLFNLISTLIPITMNKMPVIFYGAPGKKKTTMIKLLAFIQAKQQSLNFNINFVKIDAVTSESLLGYKNKKGMFRRGLVELIIEGIKYFQPDEKETKDVLYDFENQFCTIPAAPYVSNKDNKLKSESKIVIKKKNQTNKLTENDWIVIESSSALNKNPHQTYLDYALDGFQKKHFNLINSDIVKIPRDIYSIFELESLTNLSPSNIHNYFLCYFSTEIFDLKQEFIHWFEVKCSQNSYFAQFGTILKILFAFFFLEYMKQIDYYHKDETFLYRLSKKAYLRNFLHYLEIFFNEIRKFDIACGEYEVSNSNIPVINLRRQRKNKRQTQLYEFEQLSNILNTHINTEQSEIGGVDPGIRLICTMESIFIFALTYSVAINLRNEKKIYYQEFIEKQINQYISYRIKNTTCTFDQDKYPFGLNLRDLVSTERVNLFDICYDVSNQTWVKWKNVTLEEYGGVISGDFTRDTLDYREIVRLNYDSIEYLKGKIHQEKNVIFIPESGVFVETNATKITKFLMQFAVSYSKPTIVISQNQNGITSCIQNKLKTLIEHHSYSTAYISLDRGTTIKQFQKRVERNLIWKNNNHLTSVYDTNTLVVIDDLNLAMDGVSPIGALRYFYENEGWFSNSKMRFIQFSLTRMLAIYGYSPYASSNIFDPAYTVLSNSILEKSMILRMPENDNRDLASIFSAYNQVDVLLNISEKKTFLNTMKSLCAIMAITNIEYQEEFSLIANIVSGNFSIRKGIEVIKNMNYFEYFSKNRSQIMPELFFRAIVFLMNQYYASEFIYNKIEDTKTKQHVNGSISQTELREQSQRNEEQSIEGNLMMKRASFSKKESTEGDYQKRNSQTGISEGGNQKMRDDYEEEDSDDIIEEEKIKTRSAKKRRSLQLKKEQNINMLPFSHEPLIQNLEDFKVLNKQSIPNTQKVLYFLLFAEQQENSLEQLILKIGANTGAIDETGLINKNNYAPVFTKQKEEYLLKTDELLSPLNPFKNNDKQAQLNDMLDNIPSPQRKPANFKRTPLRQQSLLLELRKIEQQDNINPIKEEDDESQLQTARRQDFEDTPQNLSSALGSKNTPKQVFDFQERGQTLLTRKQKKSLTTAFRSSPSNQLQEVAGIKAFVNSPQRFGEESSKVSSDKLSQAQREADGAVPEETLQMMRLEQKVAIQMAAPSRDITNAYKSKFQKDTSNKHKRQTFILNKEQEEELFIRNIESKIDNQMNIQFEELATLPDQLVREFSRMLESELLEGSLGMNKQSNTVLSFRHELQFFNWALLDQDIDDDKQSFDSRSKDMFNYQFCLVTKKREKKVFDFILQKFRDFSVNNPFLLNNFLVRECNFESLYFHTLKLLHLLQISSSHIFLNSQFTKESTREIIKFISKILHLKLYETDITINTIEQFKQTLFEALKDLFGHESYSIFYLRISKDGVIGSSMADYNQKDMKESFKLTKVLEIIHTLVSGSEILSLFTKEQLETLISHWKLQKRFFGMNNHILYHIISKRIRSHLKIIISQEPLPKEKNIFYSLYSNLFKEFNKYLMIPIHASEDSDKKNWLQDLIQISISQSKLDLIKKIYSIELEISRVYESQYFSNIRRSFEENLSLFYLTQNIFKTQIRLKEKKLRENGKYPQMIKLMEEKFLVFESQIEINDHNLETTKHKKQNLEELLEKNTAISKQLHTEIQELLNEEAKIQQLINRVQFYEKHVQEFESRSKELVEKLRVKDAQTYNDDIKPQKFLEVVSMNVYCIAFFITMNNFLEEKFRIDFNQLEEDLKNTKNKIHFLDMPNLDFYKERLVEVVSDFSWIKLALDTMDETKITEKHLQLLQMINKEYGGGQETNLISLQSGFNVSQLQTIKFIDIGIDFVRISIEKRRFPESSQVIQEKLNVVQSKRIGKEQEKVEPDNLCARLPGEIEQLRIEQKNYMNALSKKRQGLTHFSLCLTQSRELFEEFIRQETQDLKDKKLLSQISQLVSILINTGMKYPQFVTKKILTLFKEKLNLSFRYFQHQYKISTVLKNLQYYYEVLKLEVPLNQDMIDFIAIIDFLIDYDMFYYPFIRDPSGIYSEYVKAKFTSKFRHEQYTVDPQSEINIEEALVRGETLIVEDFDQDLLEMIMPIIEWKNERMQKLLFYYMKDPADTDLASLQINQERHTLQINGKVIEVHPDFRLIMIYQGDRMTFSHTFFTKVFVMIMEIEDEERWKQTITDHLINGFYIKEKKQILETKINELIEREQSLKNSCQSVYDKLLNVEASDDLDFMNFVIDEIKMQKQIISPLIETEASLGEDDQQIEQNEAIEDDEEFENQEFFKAMQMPEPEKPLEENKVVEQQAQSSRPPLKRPPMVKRPQKPLPVAQKKKQIAAAKKQQQLEMEEKNREIMRHKNNLLKAKQESHLFTPSHSSRLMFDNRRKKMNLKQQALKTGSDQEYVKKFYHKLDELFEFSSLFLGILEFIYAVKVNWMNVQEAMGSIYSFSDKTFLLLISSSIENCKRHNHLPKSQTENQLSQKFLKAFCETIYSTLVGGLREDHQNLFCLYFALMFLRGMNQFTEFEWKMFINWNIESSESQNVFYDSLYENKWGTIKNHLISFYNLSNNLLAPLLTLKQNDVTKGLLTQGSQLNLSHVQSDNSMLSIVNPNKTEQNEQLDSSIDQSFSAHFSLQQGKKIDKRSLFALKFQKAVSKQLQQEQHENLQDNQKDQFEIFLKKQQSSQREKSVSTEKPAIKQDKFQAKEQLPITKEEEEEISISSKTISDNEINEEDELKEESSQQSRSRSSSQKEENLQSGRDLGSQDHIQEDLDENQYQQEDESAFQNFKRNLSNEEYNPFSQESNKEDNLNVSEQAISAGSIHSEEEEEDLKNSTSLKQQKTLQQIQALTNNFNVQDALENVSTRNQIKIGRKAFEGFLHLFSLFPQRTQMKHLVNSLLSKLSHWIDFQNTSLKMKNYDYNKNIIIPTLVQNIERKVTPLQLLLFVKHFRPEELQRFAKYFFRKAFKGYIEEIPQNNFDQHCQTDWMRRPTALFHHSVQKSMFEALELKMMSLQIEGGLVRLPVGILPVKNILEKITEAGGAGQWLAIENIELLGRKDLLQILKKIDQELLESTSRRTFKVWLIFNLNDEGENYEKSNFSKKVLPLLQSYLERCWKIYINSPHKIARTLNIMYNIEIQEYRARQQLQRDGKKAQSIVDLNKLAASLLESGPEKYTSINNSVIQCYIHRYIQHKQKTLREDRTIAFNLHCFLDREKLKKDNVVFEERIVDYEHKYKFALSFMFATLRQRVKYERLQFCYYVQEPFMYVSDFDIQAMQDEMFLFLSDYTLDIQVFISKFLNHWFRDTYKYGYSTYSSTIIRDLSRIFVFTAQENTTKITVHNNIPTLRGIVENDNTFDYEIYDFHQGVYPTVEEALYKSIKSFPNEDPIKILSLNQNSEFLFNYNQSQGLMNRVMEVEKKWEENKLAKLITMLDRIKFTQENIQSDYMNSQVRSFFNVHLHRYLHQHEAQLEITQLIHYLLEVLDFNFDLKTISFFKVKSQRGDSFQAVLDNWVESIQASIPSQHNSLLINPDGSLIDQAINKDLIKLNKYANYHAGGQSSAQKNSRQSTVLIPQGKIPTQPSQTAIKVNTQQQIELTRQGTFKVNKTNLSTFGEQSPRYKNQTINDDNLQSPLEPNQINPHTSVHHRQLFNRNVRKHESKFLKALQHEKEESKLRITRNRNDSSYQQSDNRIQTDFSNTLGHILASHTNQSQNSFHNADEEDSDSHGVIPLSQQQIATNLSQIHYRSQNASNFLQDEGMGDDESDFTLNQQNVYKILLLNEIISAHRLIETIRQDLQSVLDYVTNRTEFTTNLYIQDLLDCLLNNRVPINWWKQGFLLNKKTLYDFIQSFLCKHEHLNIIINSRQGQLFPIIPLQKLFNPIQLFTSLQLQFCLLKNFKLHEVKFQFRKLRKMESRQPSEGGIFVSGLYLKGGRINMENLMLEDERCREFESQLPPFHVNLTLKSKLRQEVYFKEEYNYEPNIPFELIGGENVAQGSFDKENEYFFFQAHPVQTYQHETKSHIQGLKVKPQKEKDLKEQKKMSVLTSEEQQKLLQEQIQKVINKDKQRFIDFEKASQFPVMNYIVRIPIVDSNTTSLFTQFPAKMYLYITSKKPQEYWIRKGTEIYIEKQF